MVVLVGVFCFLIIYPDNLRFIGLVWGPFSLSFVTRRRGKNLGVFCAVGVPAAGFCTA